MPATQQPHPREAELQAAASAARDRAYAPYSRFRVGAALLDSEGRIHAGGNVENAAYPQGWCAECTAIAALLMAGGSRIAAALVLAESDQVCSPCGGCRQKLREFADDDCPVLLANPAGVRVRTTLGALLPLGFGPDHLPAAE